MAKISNFPKGRPESRPSLSQLPPLTALRTFVVTARNQSFTGASRELHVTSAAIGQQIRQLEAHLGRSLFERKGHQLVLTAAGQSILPALSDAFDKILGSVSTLLDHEREPLSVTVGPSFAYKWLIPRIEHFRSKHPEIDIQIDSSSQFSNFSTGEIDCGIRYGPGDYEELYTEKLMPEWVFPVASPHLLTGPNPLRTPEDLRHHILIHDDWVDKDMNCPDWPTWLRMANVDITPRSIKLNNSALVLEAAAAGYGIALGKAALVQRDLTAGRLVRPFGQAHQVGFVYSFVAPPHKMRLGRVRKFYDWITSEAIESEKSQKVA